MDTRNIEILLAMIVGMLSRNYITDRDIIIYLGLYILLRVVIYFFTREKPSTADSMQQK